MLGEVLLLGGMEDHSVTAPSARRVSAVLHPKRPVGARTGARKKSTETREREGGNDSVDLT